MFEFGETLVVFLEAVVGFEGEGVFGGGGEFLGLGDGAALGVEFVELEEGGFVEVVGGEGGFGEDVEGAFVALAGDLAEVAGFFLVVVSVGEVFETLLPEDVVVVEDEDGFELLVGLVVTVHLN